MRPATLAVLVILLSAPVGAADRRDEQAFVFDYHGYLRAPMRVGFGRRLPEDTPGYEVSLQGENTIHEATIPDDQYLSFQSTPHNMRSWAEGFFSYGNAFVSGVLGIGSYNLTEAGFNDTNANWGITQAYVKLTPDLGYDNVRFWGKAGAIVDRYGMAGRYDAGEYDMYTFGRTHVMGETTHLDYDLTNAWMLSFEQGFGTHKPDPNAYNNARYTLLHHEHLTLRQGRDLEFGAHYLMSWSQEEYRISGLAMGADYSPRNGLPRGTLWVTGVDAKAELGPFGYIYGAFTHVGARYALTVSRAIEVLHASGGGEFDLGVSANYLDSPNCGNTPPRTPPPPVTQDLGTPTENWGPRDINGCSDGNGHVNALTAQYEFSAQNFAQQITGGQQFHGKGLDAVLKVYALAAFAKSRARDTTTRDASGLPTPLALSPDGYAVRKVKVGTDLEVQVLPWLSPAVRFDRVVPNHHVAEQSFSVFSPRIELKSDWVAHERVTLGYSRYFYDQRRCSADPNDPLAASRCTQPPPSPVPYDGFGTVVGEQERETRETGVKRPDENVVKLEATMWW